MRKNILYSCQTWSVSKGSTSVGSKEKKEKGGSLEYLKKSQFASRHALLI